MTTHNSSRSRVHITTHIHDLEDPTKSRTLIFPYVTNHSLELVTGYDATDEPSLDSTRYLDIQREPSQAILTLTHEQGEDGSLLTSIMHAQRGFKLEDLLIAFPPHMIHELAQTYLNEHPYNRDVDALENYSSLDLEVELDIRKRYKQTQEDK